MSEQDDWNAAQEVVKRQVCAECKGELSVQWNASHGWHGGCRKHPAYQGTKDKKPGRLVT